MKKWILIIGGIILIGIGIKINSDLNDVVEAFNSEHSLNEPNLIILLDSISPNKNYTYYKYKFDKGGLGYSRIFWSVTKIDKNENELEKGLIPNGYKIIGWTDTSGLSLQKWKPHYETDTAYELKDKTEFNGIEINVVE